MKVLKWLFCVIITAVSVAAIVYAVLSKDICISCFVDKVKRFFADFFSSFLTEEDFCDLPVDEDE